ncbi:MAG: DNA-protecting protein DprA [Fibrobacter sp.]|nr:DNA-protecting protein DprA [Fibrobacter sp.]
MVREWIALNAVSGLGPVRIAKLLEQFGTPRKIFEQSVETIKELNLLPSSCVAALFNDELFVYADKQLQKAYEHGVEIMTIQDSDYPQYLKAIYAPPPVLYIKGNRSAFKNHAVGLVGTRNPTTYGRTSTVQITKELVGCGLTIVSGLARGIDTVAHETTLSSGGCTIAVLGCGIDYIYPKQNEKLAKQISETGLLVSEFPMGIYPDSFNFPRRNRIISGLSSGVVVVEAGLKSGSLITAQYALAQGRDVYAVPGPINSPVSTGTFNLIRDGAIPARSGREIAESLQMMTSNQLNFREQYKEKQPEKMVLSAEEENVYNQIGTDPIGTDIISEKTGCAIGELLCILLNLELKGMINQISGQLFVRN